jgi:acetyltransferase
VLVGATERIGFAKQAYQNLDHFQYSGDIYVVNPTIESIWGRTSYPNLKSLPSTPDLALVFVGRDRAFEVVEECASVGVRAVVLIASGYADYSDSHGSVLQSDLSTFVLRHRILLCGPNCLGIINRRAGIAAYCGPSYVESMPGNLAIVSQSGGNTSWLMQAAYDRHLGISYAISSGNEAGLDLCDYMEFLVADSSTSALCLYIETIRNPRRFLEVAQEAYRRQKPIIAIKVGHSAQARRAALAHTGSFSGPDEYVDALFERSGVLRATDLDDAMDKCILFCQLPRHLWPKGRRFGIFAIGGGLATLTADLAAEHEIDLPPYPEHFASDLRTVSPKTVAIENPIEVPGITAGSSDRQSTSTSLISRYVKGCLVDAEFDGVLVACGLTDPSSSGRFLAALEESVVQIKKPVILCQPAVKAIPESWQQYMSSSSLALVEGLSRCFVSLKAVVEYREKRKSSSGLGRRTATNPALAMAHAVEVQAIRNEMEGEVADGRRIASHTITESLLAAYGFNVVSQALVSTVDMALKSAGDFGYPVVAKFANSDLTSHKTDVGGVYVNLRDAAELRRAVKKLLGKAKSIGESSCEIVVQEMLFDCMEIYLGASTTGYGYPPAVLVGSGGIAVEVMGDVVMRLAPLNQSSAGRMVRTLRSHRLMTGLRGTARFDVGALADALVRLSTLVLDFEGLIGEMDINPGMLFRQGKGMKVVDAIVTYDTTSA